MKKLVEQIQNPKKTSMISPKGILEATGTGAIFDALTPKQGGTSLLSTEGVLMMSVGIILDFLSIICAILILAAGIGLLLSKIVYAVGFMIVIAWSIFRGGGIQQGKGKISKQVSKGIGSFLKKYRKNLATKAIPAIGDVIPLWTLTIYTELKS